MDDEKRRANEWVDARARHVEIARFTHSYQPIICTSSEDVYGYEIFSAAIDLEGNRVPPDQLLSGIADDLYLCELDQRMMHSASQVRVPNDFAQKRFVNGAKVICEGIETEQCMDAVRELGADFAQGCYIARPKEA